MVAGTMRPLMSERTVLHVLPHSGGGGEEYVKLLEGMPGYRFRRTFLSEGRRPLGAAAAIPGVRRLAADCDLLHVHGDAAAVLCLPVLGMRPSVITLHGLNWLRRSRGLRRALVGRGLRGAIGRARVTICVSESERQLAAATAGQGATLELIRNGVRVPELPGEAEREAIRREIGAEADDLVALYAGQLEPHKDPLTFAVGIGLARERGTAVVGFLVGEGSLRRRLEAHRGLRLLGHRDDLLRLLGGCDVFVSTSLREGLSLVLLEAMSLARPVIVSDGPGNPEAVGDAGLVIPAREPDALAAALERLATDSALRARLGRAARERVSSEFSAERMVEQTRGVYERAIAARSAATSRSVNAGQE